VAIARALVNDPRVLLADEPTGALDSATTKQIMALLVDLHRAGVTVVVVTHDPNVGAYADRILRFADGRIVAPDEGGERASGQRLGAAAPADFGAEAPAGDGAWAETSRAAGFAGAGVRS
jgi:ABC-type phosphate/phosphonate transport system ATPase subunit